MKIAFLMGQLNRGGTETLIYDILRYKSDAPFEMICIYSEDGVMSELYQSTNIKLIKLPRKIGADFNYLNTLRKILKEEKVDIIHTQRTIESCYAWMAKKFTNMKLIHTFHGYHKHQTKKGMFLFKRMIRRTDMNIFVSNSQMNYYINKYPKFKRANNKLVYNGIDYKKINTYNDSFREDGKILLGCVGNFVPVRDHFTICKFLLLLKQTNIPFKFLFIGKKQDDQPELYDNCYLFCKKNNLLEHVHFLGTRQDVPEILPQLDAFIYSTDHDTFGIAVIEAIAAGIPVLVNDWEVMLEITENGKYATIYKTKDPEDLLSKFKTFMKNKEFEKKKAQENSTYIIDKYSIQSHIKNLYREYLSLKSDN